MVAASAADGRGISLGCLLLLTLALLAACDLPEPTATPTPTATPAPASIPVSAAQIFDEARLTIPGRPFHVEGDFQISSPEAGISLRFPLTISVDIAPNGDFAGTVSVTTPALGDISTSFVHKDNAIYAINPLTGEWGMTSDLPVPLDPVGLLPPEILNLTFAGEETLEGIEVYHLKGTVPPATLLGEGSGQLAVDYWIGVRDGLVRMIEGVGQISVEVSQTVTVEGQADFILTVALFDEPVTITIEVPGEFQDVSKAAKALMKDNSLGAIPNPVTANTAPCTTGTQHMGAFPDTASTVATADKLNDPNGTAYTDGIDPAGDKDGYLLFGHDITGDNAQATLVNYVNFELATFCYTVTRDGLVNQYALDGTLLN